jgi:hypothetical protein
MGISESLRVIYRHAPITTPNSGNAAARRKALTTAGIASGKVWVQSSGTVFVRFGGDTVDAGGTDGATAEVELLSGSAQPVLDTGGATHVSVFASADARVVIQEVL